MTEPKRDEVVGLGEHTPVSQADGHAACSCGTKEHPSVDPPCPTHGIFVEALDPRDPHGIFDEAVRLTKVYEQQILDARRRDTK